MSETGEPLSGAVVRLQATDRATVTDAEGAFRLDTGGFPENHIITAWKEGYLNGGVELRPGRDRIVIELSRVSLRDNRDYAWISSNPPTTVQKLSAGFRKVIGFLIRNSELGSDFDSNCANCHSPLTTSQWKQDPHSRSAVNPVLLTMYNGTDMDGNEGVFPGYRLDFPQTAGNCASCHAPAHAVDDPWNADLNEVGGVAAEGVFCDFCHKIRSVEYHPGGGFPGVLSIRLNRPARGEQLFYGPYDDIIEGPDAYNPLYRKSLYCAPCHSARFWGVSIYSDYDEWLKSPYAEEGVECQDCHMTPDGVTTLVVSCDKGGIPRKPQTIATHTNPGTRDAEFLADAIRMELAVEKRDGRLEVMVSLTNEKAGHHYPTGVPMRNMILLVEAETSSGEELEYIDGPVVPDWGGVGPPGKGFYAGLPGKGFAKILSDIQKHYPRFNADVHSPTPHWRQAVITSDNRIPARATDVSRFAYRPGGSDQDCIRITARLIYRRAFKSWIEAKGWPLEDMEIARSVYRSCDHLASTGDGEDPTGGY